MVELGDMKEMEVVCRGRSKSKTYKDIQDKVKRTRTQRTRRTSRIYLWILARRSFQTEIMHAILEY